MAVQDLFTVVQDLLTPAQDLNIGDKELSVLVHDVIRAIEHLF